MSARILSGTDVAERILHSLTERIASLDPKLVIVQVGSDPASDSYIRKKMESSATIGMRCEHMRLPEDISLTFLMETIARLNADADTTGYIIQLPLPAHLQPHVPVLFRSMDPAKDVDGFTAYNLGKMLISSIFEHLPPATPAGIIELLDFYEIPLQGKCVVIIGQSTIVGKPLATMCMNRNATVISCNKYTEHLEELCRIGDILVCAVGKIGLVTGSMVKKGAVVIDVGVNKQGTSIVGDVDRASVDPIASAITPVPGGVGPMTVACLLRNVVRAKERQMAKQTTL